ncbi:MAG: right-handed parallel beta-helix repeat-containing protein [bacterium]|nr:right-handed parallel beta-helix repeat-containing protein [bacterium]
MRSPIFAVAFVWFSICLPVSSPAFAATRYVASSVSASGDGESWDSAFRTIQEGIDASSRGDTVIVGEGVYLENIKFKGENITLRSTDPLDLTVVAATIIDGNQAGSVVTFLGTETEACIVVGFTIRNGRSGEGGGIHGNGSRATIESNTVSGNEAAGDYAVGAGLAFCSGRIRNNTISANTAPSEFTYGGGLAYCSGNIEDNTISENSAEEGGGLYRCAGIIQGNTISQNSASSGGALRECHGTIRDNVIAGNADGALNGCDGTVEHNTISENSARLGGALYQCNGMIQNNTITKNSAEWSEGGALFNCGGTIRNNVIAENAVTGRPGGQGGGLALCNGTIENNLIARNSASYGGGLSLCHGTIQSCTIVANSADHGGGGVSECRGVIRNCIVWGNTGGATDAQVADSNTPSFSCIQDWPGGGIGNIGDEPGFADPASGDYRLLSSSSCVDAGAAYYWFAWPQRDLDGNCRLAGSSVDMGCYEYGCSPDSDGDLLSDSDEETAGTDPRNDDTDGDGLPDGLEILRKSDPLQLTAPGVIHVTSETAAIQKSLCLAVPGDEVVVGPGHYRGNIQFCGRDVTLRGLDPHDPNVVSSTILDAGGSGPVVRFTGRESGASVLSGFTITGGSCCGSGGGISGGTSDRHTGATISNNLITGNFAVGDWQSGGGGMAYCDGIIESNTISNNLSSGSWQGVFSRPIGGNGGGLASCHGVIRNNAITANSVRGFDGYYDANGGGVAYCQGTIRNNVISANSARGVGAGLAFCHGAIERNPIIANTAEDQGGGFYGCHGVIVDNVISSNSSAFYGGGLSYCNGIIQNNLISANSVSGEPWYGFGGGVALCEGTIRNNSVVGNMAGNRGGGLCDCSGMILNCIVWGNVAPAGSQLHNTEVLTYSCIQDWTGGGEGNISEDPRFVDAENGDFRLMPDSPCIDAGFNDPQLPGFDIAGMHRIMFGGKSLTVDMGAYEFYINDLTPGPNPDQTTFTWSSLADKTYSILYTEDLLTWHLAIANFPSFGGRTTSWSDDGSLTGIPPLLAPRRFYRVLENP